MKMPIVDIQSGEISGTRYGTFEHFHETAHLEFNKSNLGMNFQYFGQMSEYFAIISLAIGLFVDAFRYISVILAIFMLFFLVYEEVWCNYRAKEMLRCYKSINTNTHRDLYKDGYKKGAGKEV